MPHLTARAKSNGFSRVAEGTLDIFSISAGMIFKARVCSATSGLLSSYEGHLKNLLEAWQGNTEASRGKEGDPVNLSSSHSDIGITINFQLESGIVTF